MYHQKDKGDTEIKFYTAHEFTTLKVYELDDTTYRKIKRKFVTMFNNEKMGKAFFEKFLTADVKTLSANSFVNIMDCFMIL